MKIRAELDKSSSLSPMRKDFLVNLYKDKVAALNLMQNKNNFHVD